MEMGILIAILKQKDFVSLLSDQWSFTDLHYKFMNMYKSIKDYMPVIKINILSDVIRTYFIKWVPSSCQPSDVATGVRICFMYSKKSL